MSFKTKQKTQFRDTPPPPSLLVLNHHGHVSVGSSILCVIQSPCMEAPVAQSDVLVVAHVFYSYVLCPCPWLKAVCRTVTQKTNRQILVLCVLDLAAEQNIFASFVCLQVLFLCRSLVFREQSFSASSWPQMALKALLGELGLSFTTITVIRHSRLKAFLRNSRTLLKSYLDVYKSLTCSVTSVTLPTSLSLTWCTLAYCRPSNLLLLHPPFL